jgi:hypothetical protein
MKPESFDNDILKKFIVKRESFGQMYYADPGYDGHYYTTVDADGTTYTWTELEQNIINKGTVTGISINADDDPWLDPPRALPPIIDDVEDEDERELVQEFYNMDYSEKFEGIVPNGHDHAKMVRDMGWVPGAVVQRITHERDEAQAEVERLRGELAKMENDNRRRTTIDPSDTVNVQISNPYSSPREITEAIIRGWRKGGYGIDYA